MMKLKNGPELSQRVLHGRAREGKTRCCFKLAHALGCLRIWVLDILGLVKKTAAEVQSGVIGAVPAEQGVGGDRHVNMVNLGEQLSPFLFCPRDDQCF